MTRLSVTRRTLCAAGIALSLSASAFAQAAAQQPLSSQDAALVSVTARIEAINPATREITLKGPLGNVVTFTVDTRVTRFNEFKVGDEITADYYVSLAAELRPPTEEEKKNPVTVQQQLAKAPLDTAPAAGGLRVTKAIVTIEGLDRPTKTITVKTPSGQLLTTEVKDVANLSKVHIGDTLAVTYTEALAISLEKRVPRK
jgi:Cu/Ag efflux protein CusF